MLPYRPDLLLPPASSGAVFCELRAAGPGHDAKWDVRSRKRREQLLKNCTEQLTIGTQPSLENYAKQNRCLADHADFLIAVSDGEGEMVGYARKKKMGILRIHPDTVVVDGDVWVGEA